MIYNDDGTNKQDYSMNLTNTHYQSILCDQGKLLMKQRDHIEENGNGMIEGFASSIVEGFHEKEPSKINDNIKNMDTWMKREFNDLDNITDNYDKIQGKYDDSEGKFDTESKGFLQRTSKDNSFNGKTIRFKDGEVGYVTQKGYLRDYDAETYAQVGDKNKCNSQVVNVETSRADFVKSDSQKVGPKMRLNKSDIRILRFIHNNNYFHISEVEAFDSQDKALIIPAGKSAQLAFYCAIQVTKNDFKNGGDTYKVFLTYNGNDISEAKAIRADSLPRVRKSPGFIGNSLGELGRGRNTPGMRRVPMRSREDGMIVEYWAQQNCNNFYWNKPVGSIQHAGPLNFDWGGGRIIDNTTDYMGIFIRGYIQSPVTGTIKFRSYSDDGQGFIMQGRWIWYGLQLNHGRSDAGRYYGDVQVEKGVYYPYYFLWRECGGGANATLYWTLPGGTQVPIPAKYFSVGGTSDSTKQGVIYQTFDQVKGPVNGFRVEAPVGTLKLNKQVRVWVKPKNDRWGSKGSQYFDTNNDPYGVIQITKDSIVSLPPHNPYVVSATISTGTGWGGHPHYPLDGNKNNKWPNSIHSASWQNIVYDIVLDNTASEVEKIRIRNRSDCCQDRLNGARLQLLDGDSNFIMEFKLNASLEQTITVKSEPKGTSCGSEGKNVVVTNVGDLGDAKYLGCYGDGGDRRMKWEGKWGTFEQCKQYAIDNKSPYFALQASDPNRDVHACMIGDDLARAVSYGTRPERCPTRPYSKAFGPVGSGWTNAVYSVDGSTYKYVDEKAQNISETLLTKTGVDLGQCMNTCEINGECNAIEYDENAVTRSGLPDLYMGENTTTSTIRSDKNVSKYLSSNAYEIHVGLNIQSDNGNWRNIFHYGDQDWERGPAMWIFPSMNYYWLIHFRVRTTTDWNNGVNIPIPQQFRGFGKNLDIRVKVDDSYQRENYVLISAWINGVSVITQRISGRKVYMANKAFFIKDPWYTRDGYAVRSVTIKDAYSRNEKGKCLLKSGTEVTSSSESTTKIYNKLVTRPFVHGVDKLDKIGYVDEQGVLHEYPKNMTYLENKWESKTDMDSPGNDIPQWFSYYENTWWGGRRKRWYSQSYRNTRSVEEAKNYIRNDSNAAGFCRHPDGRTWFKTDKMWPLNQNGPQRYANRLQLHYKTRNFRNNITCTNDVSEISTATWMNYDKGSDMTMDTKCGISNYTDDINNDKASQGSQMAGLTDQASSKITRITQRRAMLAPYLKKANARIGGIVDETQQITGQGDGLLGNNQEGMASMDEAYHGNMSPGLPSTTLPGLHEPQDSASALVGILGIAGVIMGASFLN